MRRFNDSPEGQTPTSAMFTVVDREWPVGFEKDGYDDDDGARREKERRSLRRRTGCGKERGCGS